MSLPIVDLRAGKAQSRPQGAPAASPRGRYALVSLGCPKNLVDTESMLGALALDGYQLESDPTGCDFVVINTCGFIDRARDESLAVIEEILELKRAGAVRGVIVSGCLAERDRGALFERFPTIDALVGVFGRDEISRAADRVMGNLDEQRTIFRPSPVRPLSDAQRLRVTPRHYAYLKISEGCDRLCTFCAIPNMRGKHRSKPIEAIVHEARELAADGVRELVLVAQDTTYYGMDLYGETRLAELLRALAQVDGVQWIRLMYLYPMYVTDELVDVLAQTDQIVPYLDMPLQHISDPVLRRMQRRVRRADVERLVSRLRSAIDGLVLRTTFIVGFPGETDAQFEELVEFARREKFERVGVFTYSYEPDTPAARLDGHLSEEIRQERYDRLMVVQQEIAFDWCQAQIGTHREVLIDQQAEQESDCWIGRSAADAPEIDPVVYVTGEGIGTGDFVGCEIVAAHEYDLVAAAVDSPR